MAKSNALAQLRDIHLPEPVSWWPLAPGWYGLIVLVLITFIVSIYLLYSYYSKGRAKRQALHLLSIYHREYDAEKNAQKTSARISELLRRVALVYYPRATVASLQGEAWLKFLNETGKNIDFNLARKALLELPYQQTADSDLTPFFDCARVWIKQRRQPCSN